MAWCYLLNIYMVYELVSILMIVKLIFQVNIIDGPVLEIFAWCHYWWFRWCAKIIFENVVSYCLGWCYIYPPSIRLIVSNIKRWKRMTMTQIYTSSHLLIVTPWIDRTSMHKIMIYHMVISFDILVIILALALNMNSHSQTHVG